MPNGYASHRSLFAVIGSRGRSASVVTSPPAWMPAARKRPAWTPSCVSSRSTRARSRASWSCPRWSGGIASASGSNMCLTSGPPGRAVRAILHPRVGKALLFTRPGPPGGATAHFRAYHGEHEHSARSCPGTPARDQLPADRSALVAMRKLTGFDVLLRRLASLFSDRSLRLLFLASSVRASQEQFPHLY